MVKLQTICAFSTTTICQFIHGNVGIVDSIFYNYPDIIEELDEHRNTLLHYAIEKSPQPRLKLVSMLTDRSTSLVHMSNDKNMEALLLAVLAQDLSIVSLLCDAIGPKYSYEETSALEAAMTNAGITRTLSNNILHNVTNCDVVHCILTCRPDLILVLDKDGNTPLHKMCIYCNGEDDEKNNRISHATQIVVNDREKPRWQISVGYRVSKLQQPRNCNDVTHHACI